VSERVEFRVLGPFEVARDGSLVGPAGSKRRGVLAMMVLRANRAVPAGDLVDGLWAGDCPPTAANVVQTYVSAWRKALEPDRAARGGGTRLATVGPAYRLRVDPEELDLDLFLQAVAEGTAAVARGDSEAGAARLGVALGLWRGPPLADLAGLPFHDAAAASLAELRLQAVEEWAAATLACGNARQVLPALTAARDSSPLRERLSELLMWALLQDGRQAEALGVYEETRRVLADELGADPGTGLREMQSRVLRQDPALRPPPGAGSGHRLPVLTDSFVGRGRELSEVGALIKKQRLVSLTGPGGCGKTRLAIEVASRLTVGGEARAVFFVDAAPLPDAALIPDRLVRAMGVRPGPGQSTADALARAVGDRQLIAVVDNLEHLPDAAPVVVDLLRAGPGLRLLATSRAPLHARGEHLYPVPPLALPGPGLPASPAAHTAAVELFADRATAADPAFQLTAENLPLVAEICQGLDGLPLAIELAASRARVLPPASLLARLNRRLDLLSGAAGDRPARHQTLRATIDWSYQLLDDTTRTAFRALAVFRGGWNIPAAAVVCDQAEEVALLGRLEALVDASLIEPAAAAGGSQRFRMLESLREFALERLTACGEEQAARARHADFAYRLAIQTAPELTGPQQISCLDKLEADRDNIGSALRWLTATGQAERGLRIAAPLWRFWHLRGHLEEGRGLLEALLTAPDARLQAPVRADGLSALGSVAYWQRDNLLAYRCYKEALALYEQANAMAGIALSQYNLGFTAAFDGDYHAAGRYFTDALAGYENLADQLGASNALAGLAFVDRVTGNYERGQQRAAHSLTQQRLLGEEFGAANTLSLLGSITSQMGHIDKAETMLREALILHDQAGNVSGITWMLRELAGTAASRGQPERAIILSSAAQSLEDQLGGGIPIHVLRITEPVLLARQQLDPARAQQAAYQGGLMTPQQAVAAALSGP
jgi:predicted ATPase/DNA-binding SARP family transcriptional activator